MAIQSHTHNPQVRSAAKSLPGSPQVPRYQGRFTRDDSYLPSKSTQKFDEQFQKFKNFYNDHLPVPKIIVSSPGGTTRDLATPADRPATKKAERVYGCIPKSLRSPHIPSPSVVPVQYIDGKTITCITIDYPKYHPNDRLSICGNGPHMSWEIEKALPLQDLGYDIWVYKTHRDFEQFEYKLVLNGEIWEEGPKRKIDKNKPHQITQVLFKR